MLKQRNNDALKILKQVNRYLISGDQYKLWKQFVWKTHILLFLGLKWSDIYYSPVGWNLWSVSKIQKALNQKMKVKLKN